MEAFARPQTGHFHKTRWKIPFFFAFFLHLVLFFGTLYAPDMFKAKPKFAEIHTVSLVNMAAPAKSGSSPVAKPTTPQKTPLLQEAIKPETAKTEPLPKESVPVTEPSKKVAVPKSVEKISPKVEVEPANDASPKTISLNPKKRKIRKKAIDTPDIPQKPKVDLKKKRREAEKARRKARDIAEKLKQEARLEEQVRQAKIKARQARQALEEEQALFRQAAEMTDIPPARRERMSPTPTQGVSAAPTNGGSSAVSKQYYSTVKAVIGSHWALPPNLDNLSNLQAIVIITINQNGQILDMFFEKESTSAMFNQFVRQSINASAPLPPIPPVMRTQRIELGLNFSPTGVN